MTRRGIALMLVLIMTGLIVLLMGALFGSSQASFSLLGSGWRRREAQQAAESGLALAVHRLELNRTWSEQPFAGNVTTWAGELTIREVAGGHRVQADYQDGRSFSLAVENFLQKTGQPADMPAASARVRSRGASGAFVCDLEAVYEAAPLYDASMVSDGPINMTEIGNWTINSTDRFRNWVRSNSDIYTPDFVADPTHKFMHFDLGGGLSPFSNLAWSRGDVFVGPNTPANSSFLPNTKGFPVTRSALTYNIYDLKMDDLTHPAVESEVPAGRYSIQSIGIDYDNGTKHAQCDCLVHTDPAGLNSTYIPTGSLPAGTGLTYPPGFGTVTNVSGTDIPIARGMVCRMIPIPGVPDVSPPISAQFVMDSNVSLHVAGDGNLTIDSETPTGRPFVFFKPVGNQAGFLYSRNGEIKLMSSLFGYGGIAAGSNLTVASDAAVASGNGTNGLVLYSGHDMIFDVSQVKVLLFQGLVYAKHDVDMGGFAHLGLNGMAVRGAVVAREGKIAMASALNVLVQYDSSYLKNFTRGLPNNHVRLSRVSYKIR